MTESEIETFIKRHARLRAVPLVPEVSLYLADDPLTLWQITMVEGSRLSGSSALPYWAVAWPGGQALARFLLDHPETVAGKRVLDLATGSGVVAIAAVMAGAQSVRAIDLDPVAAVAAQLNAATNRTHIEVGMSDIATVDGLQCDVVLAGDVFYEREMAEELLPILQRYARHATVLVGDPGREYLPRPALSQRAEYDVPETGATEDRDLKRTGIWQVHPEPDSAS